MKTASLRQLMRKRSRSIQFFTLGCKVNQYETQSIRQRFLNTAFSEAKAGRSADYFLVNTCSVTASADQKSRHLIRKCIRINPQASIIVTGCLVRKDWMSLAGIKGVSLLIDKKFFPDGIKGFSGRTRAFLKLQDGCSNFCSYCKVPVVRGPSRSRQAESVVQEAAALARNGHKEIVLCGICLGAYGKDLAGNDNLLSLIARLEKLPGLLRLRLSSIEAGDVSAGLIDKLACSSVLCPHLHIPIQSGDDRILKLMRRSYTRGDYLKLAHKLKKKVPGIAITTDCLVGFPGENEDNFRNTVSLIKEIQPLKVHIFPFSCRPGTQAQKLKGQIDPKAIETRVKELKEAAQLCAAQFYSGFINKEASVLVEAKVNDKTCWEGFSRNYIKVRFIANDNLAGRLVRVRLKRVVADGMIGDCGHSPKFNSPSGP